MRPTKVENLNWLKVFSTLFLYLLSCERTLEAGALSLGYKLLVLVINSAREQHGKHPPLVGGFHGFEKRRKFLFRHQKSLDRREVLACEVPESKSYRNRGVSSLDQRALGLLVLFRREGIQFHCSRHSFLLFRNFVQGRTPQRGFFFSTDSGIEPLYEFSFSNFFVEMKNIASSIYRFRGLGGPRR